MAGASIGMVIVSALAAVLATPQLGRAAAAPASTSGALFTADQAARGRENYEHYCRACHGDHLDDGDMGGPPLNGAYFRTHWGSTNLAALFAFTKGAMPPDNPGGLNDETYADILSYILQYNGYRAGPNRLPTDPAAQARMKLARPPG